MEIKKIIVIFSITLLCHGKVMHNVGVDTEISTRWLDY